jgi:hypothetical protein
VSGRPLVAGKAETAEPSSSQAGGDKAAKHKMRKHHHKVVADSNAETEIAPAAASRQKVLSCSCLLHVQRTMLGHAPHGHETNKQTLVQDTDKVKKPKARHQEVVDIKSSPSYRSSDQGPKNKKRSKGVKAREQLKTDKTKTT